jgi:hypothetical protein
MSDGHKENQRSTFSSAIPKELEREFSTPLQRTEGLKRVSQTYPPRSEAVPTPPQKTRALKSRLKLPQVKATSVIGSMSVSPLDEKSTPEFGDERDRSPPRFVRRKLPFNPSAHEKTRKLSEIQTVGLTDKKRSDELPDFFPSPESSDLVVREPKLRKAASLDNLVRDVRSAMRDSDSASGSSPEDSDTDKDPRSPKTMDLDPAKGDDTFCQFPVDL